MLMTMIQQQQQQMGGAGAAVGKSNGYGNGQADTSLTKIFVGGLAWETKKETMKKYFEQFGDIQEAVVIMDKNTGRSKGYGFVTFKDADSARKACADPAPVIDGRRANCNLASLGASRTRPSPPSYGNRFRSGPHFQGASQSGMPAYNGGMAFPHPVPYQYQQGYPYTPYGFPAYAPDFSFAQGYYNPYAAAAQFPQIYHAGAAAAAMGPPHAQGAGGGYMQGPGPHIVHYSSGPGLVATSAPSVPASVQTSGVPSTGASSGAINRSPRQAAAQHYAISMPLPQYAAVAAASEPTAT